MVGSRSGRVKGVVGGLGLVGSRGGGGTGVLRVKGW